MKLRVALCWSRMNQSARGERVAVECRVGQRGERAAQVDTLAFAEVALGHDARDALQGLRQVLVGKFADILRGDDFLDARCLALGFQRLAHARAVAVNHNLFDSVVAVGSGASAAGASARAAPLRPNSAMATAVPTKVDLAILIVFHPTVIGPAREAATPSAPRYHLRANIVPLPGNATLMNTNPRDSLDSCLNN